MVDIEDPKGQFISLAEVAEVERCTARLMQSKHRHQCRSR